MLLRSILFSSDLSQSSDVRAQSDNARLPTRYDARAPPRCPPRTGTAGCGLIAVDSVPRVSDADGLSLRGFALGTAVPVVVRRTCATSCKCNSNCNVQNTYIYSTYTAVLCTAALPTDSIPTPTQLQLYISLIIPSCSE